MLNWVATTSFETLIKEMVDEEIKTLNSEKKHK